MSVPLTCVGWGTLLRMNLFVSVDQSLCFTIDRIPTMRRADYLVFAHEDLPGLNGIEKVQPLLSNLRR